LDARIVLRRAEEAAGQRGRLRRLFAPKFYLAARASCGQFARLDSKRMAASLPPMAASWSAEGKSSPSSADPSTVDHVVRLGADAACAPAAFTREAGEYEKPENGSSSVSGRFSDSNGTSRNNVVAMGCGDGFMIPKARGATTDDADRRLG